MSLNWSNQLLSVKGQQLHIRSGIWQREEGRARGPVIVLLHEALGTISMWKQFPEQLAQATGLDLLVYERLGYGRSSPITLPRDDDYLEQEGSIWLPALLDELGLDEVILFGHSDGGSIAMIGAATMGDRVKALITAASHIYFDHLTEAGIKEAVERYQNSDLPQRLERHHGERTELLFRAWSETWLRPSYAQAFSLKPYLGKITAPSLIMQGEQDQYGVPEQVTDSCREIGERAKPLFIENCGHVPHLEAQERVVEEVLSFLKEESLLEA